MGMGIMLLVLGDCISSEITASVTASLKQDALKERYPMMDGLVSIRCPLLNRSLTVDARSDVCEHKANLNMPSTRDCITLGLISLLRFKTVASTTICNPSRGKFGN